MAGRSRLLSLLLALAALVAAGTAEAIDYRSVQDRAVLHDTPSDQGKKLYLIARGTPVELVVEQDRWAKVRDPDGTISWIERRLLSKQRMLIVTAERAQIRQSPSDTAPLLFEAERQVLLEFVEPAGRGWARVRHSAGEGYLRANQVWGL